MTQEFAALAGRWKHSFEEDDAGVQVYRPESTFAFPPARRGRETLSFDASGQAAMGAPGPDDRTRMVASGLGALGMNRYRLGDQVIEVVEARPDVLKLRFLEAHA